MKRIGSQLLKNVVRIIAQIKYMVTSNILLFATWIYPLLKHLMLGPVPSNLVIVMVLRYQYTPKVTIFPKKMFFAFSDRSYYDLSF